MSGKFWRTKVHRSDIQNGYYPDWKRICKPGVWTVDASGFSHMGAGAWAVLAPSGRLLTGTESSPTGAAPEFRGIIEAVRLIPTNFKGAVVETDQLSVSSILHNGNTEHALKLADTTVMWRELLDLFQERDVTIRWVRGHGKRSNARMAVVDEASRKAARMEEG